MKLKINTDTTTTQEWLAFRAFAAVMAGDVAPVYLPDERVGVSGAMPMRQTDEIKPMVHEVAAPIVHVDPQVAPTPSTVPDLDKNDLPWDERIHSSSKAITADGFWRIRRNLDPAVLEAVTAELKGAKGVAGTSATEPENTADLSTVQTPAQDAADHTARTGEPVDTTTGEVLQFPVPDGDGGSEPSEPTALEKTLHGHVETGGNGPSAFMLGADDIRKMSDSEAADLGLQPDNNRPISDAEAKDLGLKNASHSEGPFADTFDKIATAPNWVTVKMHLGDVTKSDVFKAMSEPASQALRAELWQAIEAAGVKGDHAADPTAFFFWMYDQTDADAVEGTYRALQSDPAYGRMVDTTKDHIRKCVLKWATELRAKQESI